MTTNAKALQDMFDECWNYLTGHGDFAALGVKTFNGIRGETISIGQDNSISALDLPAFVLERPRNLYSAANRDDSAKQRVLKYALDFAFIFPAESSAQANPAYRAMNAELVAEDILGADAARLGGLAGSPGVDDYEVIPGETDSVPSISNDRLILYWVSRFTVVLTKQITFAQA